MPKPNKVTKALLQEIQWVRGGPTKSTGTELKVQFNPESLKVTFANQIAGGTQSGGAAMQFSGKGTTKLAFDLWFDVTDPNIDPAHRSLNDVRRITKKVAGFMRTRRVGSGREVRYIPPGVRFLWGTFLFEGVMESINETLEFFSDDGRPLRASVSVSLVKQDVQVRFGDELLGKDASVPGSESTDQVQQGDTLQDVEARNGRPEKWVETGQKNDIENPRHLTHGTRLR